VARVRVKRRWVSIVTSIRPRSMLVPRFCSLSGSAQCDMKTPGRRITAQKPEGNLIAATNGETGSE
jgi:hypothetical protein